MIKDVDVDQAMANPDTLNNGTSSMTLNANRQKPGHTPSETDLPEPGSLARRHPLSGKSPP